MNKQFVLAAAIAAAFTATFAAPAVAAGEAKNVVFFLGDGMGPVTKTAARIYSVKEEGKLGMDTMPYTARIKTYSLDAQTTDSAPSMAAYMTGVKENNEVLSMSGDTAAIAPGKDPLTGVGNSVNNCLPTNGTPVQTLTEYAIAQGKATGAVTTTRFTHATPAATYAHICHRNAEYDIARQAVPGGAGFNTKLGAGLDVMMGGITKYWRPFDKVNTPAGRPDGRDLINELTTKNGYTFASDLTSFNALPTTAGSKVIALFDFAASQGHMPYEADRDPTKEPSLAQMTTKAIDILSKNPKGYFLMVEGGRIDHALHETNAKRALIDTIAFDDAIKAALAKVDLSNSLIVVTADHDHTMAFNGYGKRGTPILGNNINYQTGKPSLDADGVPYSTLVFGNGPNRKATRVTVDTAAVQDLNYQQESAIKVGNGNESHGGGDVQLYSAGAGAKTFKGTIDNTKVFSLVKAAAGL